MTVRICMHLRLQTHRRISNRCVRRLQSRAASVLTWALVMGTLDRSTICKESLAKPAPQLDTRWQDGAGSVRLVSVPDSFSKNDRFGSVRFRKLRFPVRRSSACVFFGRVVARSASIRFGSASGRFQNQMARFGSVRFGSVRPVRCGFLFLPEMGRQRRSRDRKVTACSVDGQAFWELYTLRTELCLSQIQFYSFDCIKQTHLRMVSYTSW